MNRLTVKPVGSDNMLRFITATGLVNWHYHGTPIASEVTGADGVIPVWLFYFGGIQEDKMRVFMLRTFMAQYSLSQAKALEWLAKDYITIPQANIEFAANG